MGVVYNLGGNISSLLAGVKYKASSEGGKSYSRCVVRKKLTRKSQRLLRSLGHRIKPR